MGRGRLDARCQPAAGHARVRRYRKSTRSPTRRLERVRDQGFSIEWLGPSALRLVQVLQDVHQDLSGLGPLLQALVVEITRTGLAPGPGRQPVSTIVAPIVSRDGQVNRTLNAHPFHSMTPARAIEIAHRLMAAAPSVDRLASVEPRADHAVEDCQPTPSAEFPVSGRSCACKSMDCESDGSRREGGPMRLTCPIRGGA